MLLRQFGLNSSVELIYLSDFPNPITHRSVHTWWYFALSTAHSVSCSCNPFHMPECLVTLHPGLSLSYPSQPPPVTSINNGFPPLGSSSTLSYNQITTKHLVKVQIHLDVCTCTHQLTHPAKDNVIPPLICSSYLGGLQREHLWSVCELRKIREGKKRGYYKIQRIISGSPMRFFEKSM